MSGCYRIPQGYCRITCNQATEIDEEKVKRILESEADPCKRFLAVNHGYNLRSSKLTIARLRIPLPRNNRHKQASIPRGAELNVV